MAERPKEKRVLVALPRRHCVRIVFSISVATGCAVTCPGKKLQHYLIWDCDSLFLPDPSNPLFTRHPSRVSPPQLLLRHALSRLSSPHTMDHSRDPCPWVALSDFGGAFCMGVCLPMNTSTPIRIDFGSLINPGCGLGYRWCCLARCQGFPQQPLR